MPERFQFRLRTIFLLTTAAALASSCLIPRQALRWEVTLLSRALAAACVLSVPLAMAIAFRVLVDALPRDKK